MMSGIWNKFESDDPSEGKKPKTILPYIMKASFTHRPSSNSSNALENHPNKFNEMSLLTTQESDNSDSQIMDHIIHRKNIPILIHWQA